MKQLRPALLATIVLFIVTPSFTTHHPITSSATFNENKFRASLWLKPIRKSFVASSVSLSFYSNAAAAVTINSVAVGDPSNTGSGDYPVPPGYIGYSVYEDAPSSGPAYVSITIAGPTPDPNAIRIVRLTDGLHTLCQEINGSGVYVFNDLFLSPYGYITADVGGCN